MSAHTCDADQDTCAACSREAAATCWEDEPTVRLPKGEEEIVFKRFANGKGAYVGREEGE